MREVRSTVRAIEFVKPPSMCFWSLVELLRRVIDSLHTIFVHVIYVLEDPPHQLPGLFSLRHVLQPLVLTTVLDYRLIQMISE